MTAVSRPRAVTLRSGDVVRFRQVRPDDQAALARAYARLGEESRYRRFFSAPPVLPDPLLRAAAEVDHENHEALVALPLLSREIVGECRFVRLPDRRDTAELGVTVADAWQGRGLGSALLARLSARALEVGIVYFTAQVLAENRTMLAMLAKLGNAETEASGAVVDAHIEIAEPDLDGQADLRSFLSALTRGDIIVIPAPFRLLAGASDLVARIVRLPVSALRQVLLADPEAAADEDDPDDARTDQPAAGGGEHRGKDYPDDR
jgi:RimJ/RimL family protein N-acetyltransferase